MTKPISLTTLALLLVATTAGAQAPMPDQPRAVSMTLAEYNRLLALAARTPVAPAAAPVPAVTAAADLRITIDRDTARGAFAVTGQVLHNGIARVPLLNGGAVLNVTTGGRPVPLAVEGQTLQALLPNGPFAVDVEWATPIVLRPGRASFLLPVPQAGAARARIEVPGERADVRLSAGLITRRTATIGRTVIEATLDPGSATEVSWSVRDNAPTPAAKDVRALADVLTLITLNDADVRMAALIDVTVIQGELRSVSALVPAGYEVTAVTGSSLEDSSVRDGEMVLTVADPSARSHQFLINLERPHGGGSFPLDTALVTLKDMQRERGEIGIDGAGTLDLSAADRPGLHRIDVRELSPALHALTRLPIISGFRYQRAAGTAAPQLALDIKKFEDAGVLAAVADRAIATTLITTEGRALTEIRLELRNRSLPFLKVELPPGASIVSVDLAGESAKPAAGPDGTRVPLMRAGLRTTAIYPVSFVYMHAGTPFQKKGDIQMTLPKMDIPIGVVEWELFVPEQYSARAIDGTMIDSRRFDAAVAYVPPHRRQPPSSSRFLPAIGVLAGQIRGRVTDNAGGVIPGTTVDITVGSYRRSVVSDQNGEFTISGTPQGQATITAALAGFQTFATTFWFDGNGRRMEIVMALGGITETVTVSGAAPVLDRRADGLEKQVAVPPSQNVVNLQLRAAGVLPIRVDVPRAGVAHQFIKPLVINSEPMVKFRYKRR